MNPMATRRFLKEAISPVVSAAIGPAKIGLVVARRIVTGPETVDAEIEAETAIVIVTVTVIVTVVKRIASEIATMAETGIEDAIEAKIVNETASAPVVTDLRRLPINLVHKPGE